MSWIVVIVFVAGVAVLLAALVGMAVCAKHAFAQAVDSVAMRHVEERDDAVTAALRQVDLLNRSQMESTKERLNAELAAKEDVIGSNLDAVRTEVRNELLRLGEMVTKMSESSAQRFGQVDESLRSHAEVASKLSDSTRSLREALSSPQTRGQWGERMAEDVLRLAGFTENVNYRKQAQLKAADAGVSGRPDFTFDLPKGHVLHMDVKFPLSSYLRYLEASTDIERSEHLKTFLRDVRTRVRELSKRNYSDGGKPSVDYVLLFLPNEQLTGFIHEHDPSLLDDALGQRVVMCSPLTLFAFLGVIRQAFDNFMIEQTSDEILKLVGTFNVQWRKYTESADKVKRHFVQAHEEFDRLTTTRERALERPLRQLEALRDQRALDIDDADDAPALRAVGDDV
ncbi:MAG: DNA recombination protein RmuC [Actinomycetota bacterium]|nr:DNA recombination protein RmuC [Actinomycetota bacterium]